MIHFLYGDQLQGFPELAASMFRDRAKQFSGRLKWPVSVDQNGLEKDQYDLENPLYVIWQEANGAHGGSLRFLPTTGPVMVNDYFSSLAGDVKIISPLIWECTRFCIGPDAAAGAIAPRLMLAAAELGCRFHLAHAVGVFDRRMIRVYRSLGWTPEILGSSGVGRDAISVGLWEFSSAPFDTLRMKADVSEQNITAWFNQSFAGENTVQIPA